MAKISINKVSETPEKEYAKAAKKLVLGSDRPPLFTRVILIVALIAMSYYFLWNGLRYFVIDNIDSLNTSDAAVAKAKLQKLGEEHNISDAVKTFKQYGLFMLISAAISLVGMAFIYRRKLFGYYIFLVGLVAMLLTPFITLSWSYVTSEVDFYDFIIPPVLGFIFFVSYKRLKKLKEEARLSKLV